MDERSVTPRVIRSDPSAVDRAAATGLPSPLRPRALDIVGATLVLDVEPGEWSGSTTAGCHATRFAETPAPALCIFESSISLAPTPFVGESVHEARREMASARAGAPIEADR